MALTIQRNPVLVNKIAAGTGKVVDDAQTIPIEATTVTIDEAQQPVLDATQQTADASSEQAWAVCKLDGSVTQSLFSGD